MTMLIPQSKINYDVVNKDLRTITPEVLELMEIIKQASLAFERIVNQVGTANGLEPYQTHSIFKHFLYFNKI